MEIQITSQNDYFECLVLSGGGNGGLMSLGVLQYFYENGLYNAEKCSTYVGTSVGSVICLLLICGYTPMEIFLEIQKEEGYFKPENINNFSTVIKKMGFISIRKFASSLSDKVHRKLGFVPSLLELYNLTGKVFAVTVGNVTKLQTEYYTYETNPNLSCVDAAKLSCNLPLICQAIKYNEDHIIDGGIGNNFPLDYIDDGKKIILGIVILPSLFENENGYLKDDSFAGYFYRIMVMPTLSNTLLRCEMAKENTTLIKVKNISKESFISDLTEKEKMNMFLHGYNIAETETKSKYLYIEELDNIRCNLGIIQLF